MTSRQGRSGEHSAQLPEAPTRLPGAVERAFWQRVLTGGGHTPLPRWPTAPDGRDGTATLRVAVPAGTATSMRDLAGSLGTMLDAVLLGAFAKVLAALTGDPAVVTGYLPVNHSGEGPGAGLPALPCPVAASDGSWSDLVADAARVAKEVVRHPAAALSQLRAETGRTEPLFDTVVTEGRAPQPGDLVDESVLAVGLARDGDAPELVLVHRPSDLGHDQVERIAGYLLAALHTLSLAPQGRHAGWNPVPAEERAFQIGALAGPHRDLPDRRFHELFEERAHSHPDRVAAVHDGTSLSYGLLNRRANRLARALRARGLRDEGVVAVVTERNLDWLTTVLAVFKAGGVYLPVEPHFPGERIAAMLARSDCRLAVVERDSCAAPAPALRNLNVTAVPLDELLAEDHAEDDLGLRVAAGQAAYLYFTSGSTGAPKGAVCEHAGFLNHLFAKIDDLGVREHGVVAQTAPQCFDISLWQLVAALVVGGSTLLVGQEEILDTGRFVEKIAAGNVEVLQLVPSYLEVVLTELAAHPRRLPALRCVSVTGEALKKELVERWFAAFPDVALVNAYGLTETSDDTNHEVMRGVPAQSSVPLGRPIANVRVYVVDERLDPVPLGAPGEIVFSGVCVGRGYVNDEERTRAAFLPDPHRPGERLYRSGDFGRWLRDGRLEFLGRRDAQVKIRGFRIEIGEVENRLLAAAGVRDSAVVVTGEGERRRLTGFYTGRDAGQDNGQEAGRGPARGAGQGGPAPETVARTLRDTLPAYMVPDRLHRLDALPLTPNGKTDRKALTRLAEEHAAAGAPDDRQTLTSAERRLAGVWAAALKIPVDGIGRDTHFFEAGGTSLTMLRVAVALDRRVPPSVLTSTPVLADLAALLESLADGSADATGPWKDAV